MSKGSIPLVILLLALATVGSGEIPTEFSRGDFSPGFVFGAGTSAYQVEGAVAEDGRTPSIWDTFTHSGKMADGSTGDIASDGYHRYKEDIKHMSDTGLEAYRFSISWSRLIPNGRGAVNPKGLEYYNNVINELIKYGIQPHVTLYHIDFPQVLEDEYAGWLSPKIVDDFTAYADVCFREFGDRVIHWTTVNEPNVIAMAAYDNGLFPPQRCSYPFGLFNCTAGNSTVESYIALHHVLLAHAAVFKLYRTKYQGQHGWVGINVYSFWCSPLTNSTADMKATQRALDFFVGWVMNPLVFGDYPEIMKKRAGSRIPSFTKSQSELVKGSFDFLGINHYTSIYVADASNPLQTDLRDFTADMSVVITVTKNGSAPSGQFVPTTMPVDPLGLQNMLEYLQRVYGNPPVYIQENGHATPKNSTLNDTARVDVLKGYIGAMLSAIRNGSNTRGYFVWSFLDVFEFLSGYKSRFGLYHVDFEDKDLKRQPKFSALWYRDFLKQKEVNIQKAGQQGNLHSPS